MFSLLNNSEIFPPPLILIMPSYHLRVITGQRALPVIYVSYYICFAAFFLQQRVKTGYIINSIYLRGTVQQAFKHRNYDDESRLLMTMYDVIGGHFEQHFRPRNNP